MVCLEISYVACMLQSYSNMLYLMHVFKRSRSPSHSLIFSQKDLIQNITVVAKKSCNMHIPSFNGHNLLWNTRYLLTVYWCQSIYCTWFSMMIRQNVTHIASSVYVWGWMSLCEDRVGTRDKWGPQYPLFVVQGD